MSSNATISKSSPERKIGLVTNQTGRDLKGKPTIDVLKEANGVKLVSLFSPEHGIRGLADEKVRLDGRDKPDCQSIRSTVNVPVEARTDQGP